MNAHVCQIHSEHTFPAKESGAEEQAFVSWTRAFPHIWGQILKTQFHNSLIFINGSMSHAKILWVSVIFFPPFHSSAKGHVLEK